jgi:hypothetical protein
LVATNVLIVDGTVFGVDLSEPQEFTFVDSAVDLLLL